MQSVSVASANGLAGSVANPTTPPAATLSTTVTGLLKGNGTAVSAAVANTDYAVVASPTHTGTATLARSINTPVALTDAATIAVNAARGNTSWAHSNEFFVGRNPIDSLFYDGLQNAFLKVYVPGVLLDEQRSAFHTALWNGGAGWEYTASTSKPRNGDFFFASSLSQTRGARR